MAQVLSPGGVKPTLWNFDPALVEPRWRPLHAHATILAPMWGGGGAPLDYYARERATVDGQTWTVAPRGLGTRRTANSADLYWAADARHAIDSDVPFTAIFYGHVESYDATAVFLSRRSSFAAGYWVLFRSSDTGNPIKVGLYDGGTFDELTTSLTVGTGEVLIGFSRDPGGTYRVYVNGIRDDVSATRIPGLGTQVVNVGKVQANTNANAVLGTYYYTAIAKGYALDDAGWRELWADPFGPFRPARRRRVFVAAGGTTFTRTFVGSATLSGAITRQAQKTLAGTSTASGTVTRQAQKTLTGSLTMSGALDVLKTILRTFTGSLTASGTLSRQAQKTLVGSMAAAGSLARQTAKTFSGSVTGSGTLEALRTVLLSIAGSLTATGTLTKRISKTFTGSLTPSGSLTRRISKLLVGSLAALGSLVTSLVSGNLIPAPKNALGPDNLHRHLGPDGSSRHLGPDNIHRHLGPD